jgi:hypothetical protein
MSKKWCFAFLFVGCAIGFASGCSSTGTNSSGAESSAGSYANGESGTGAFRSLGSESDYSDAVDAATQKKQVYDGLVNVMDVRATLLNTKVARLQVDQYARMYQWDEKNYSNEKSKTETNLSKQTDIFLSFFVPDRKHDDLAKSTSKWKIFLDVGGRRFDGTAKRIKTVFAEVKGLYPEHTRWSTPYLVTFPVPTSMAEAGSPKLTITGPIGSTTVNF